MSEEHLDDSQCWLVANFRHDPEVANLRLRNGEKPDRSLSSAQLEAWTDHAEGCTLCETKVQCDLHVVRRTALRGSKPPPIHVPREQSWEDMVE